MSKSLGNQVGVRDAPDEMYGKLLSLPDSAMPQYYDLLLGEPMPSDIGPRDAKHALARRIVERFHDAAAAEAASAAFEKVFVARELPDDIPWWRSREERPTCRRSLGRRSANPDRRQGACWPREQCAAMGTSCRESRWTSLRANSTDGSCSSEKAAICTPESQRPNRLFWPESHESGSAKIFFTEFSPENSGDLGSRGPKNERKLGGVATHARNRLATFHLALEVSTDRRRGQTGRAENC